MSKVSLGFLLILLSFPSFSADFERGLAAIQNGDFATALREWTPLAEQGVADAQYKIAQMYYQGLGIPQNYQMAVKYYTLAAEQGVADAQYNLAYMYGTGEGVIKDYLYAHMWWNIAASLGLEDASTNRDIVEKKMTPTDISKAQQLARECVAKKYKGC